MSAALAQLDPRVLRPTADGRYSWVASLADVERIVQGVDVTSFGILDVQLVTVHWAKGRAGDIVRGTAGRRTRRPVAVPAGAQLAVVVEVSGVLPGAWIRPSLTLASADASRAA